MGKRCMEEGCSFVWPSGESPFLVDSKGRVIVFEIKDNIPYIVTGSETCKRRKIRKRVRVPRVQDCAPNEEDNSGSESSLSSEGASLDIESEQHSDHESARAGVSGLGTPDPEAGCPIKGHKRNRKEEAAFQAALLHFGGIVAGRIATMLLAIRCPNILCS
jgi:hypothetical protein